MSTTIKVNPMWRTLSRLCGAIGVVMSAMAAALVPVLLSYHPIDELYLALQTGVIALGVYAGGKQVEEITTAAA